MICGQTGATRGYSLRLRLFEAGKCKISGPQFLEAGFKAQLVGIEQLSMS